MNDHTETTCALGCGFPYNILHLSLNSRSILGLFPLYKELAQLLVIARYYVALSDGTIIN